jgi:hypothetical protein
MRPRRSRHLSKLLHLERLSQPGLGRARLQPCRPEPLRRAGLSPRGPAPSRSASLRLSPRALMPRRSRACQDARISTSQNLGYVRQQVGETTGSCANQQHCNASGLQVLLIFDAAVHAQKDLEPGLFGQRQQLAVSLPGQPLFRNGSAIMTGQDTLQFSRTHPSSSTLIAIR